MSHEESMLTSTWAWATEHGAPEWASTEELVAWLGRGELPPHTLVWKQGWGEWLPAMQVAELAAAFPRVTAGSRRVARAAPGNAVVPPSVPIAHYPRLRLLAKDVLSESPLPPPSAPYPLVTAQAERRAFRDPDHLQQDVATSQVPAAAMLQAARAMQERGAPAARSAERWSRLELGTFGEPPPSPRAQPLAAQPLARPSREPYPCPPYPSQPYPSPPPLQRKMGYGRWLLLGALVGGTLGLLSVTWSEVAAVAARAGAYLPARLLAGERLLAGDDAAAPQPSRALDTRVLSLSSFDDNAALNACIAPAATAEPALDEAPPH